MKSLSFNLKINISCTKVTYSEPTVKGNTSSNAMKTVTVEGGAQVAVPLFIKTDEEIVINTEDGTYKERAK